MLPIAFAGYPAPFILDTPTPHGEPRQQLLWGDFVELLGEESGDWVKVNGRNTEGWIHRDQLHDERLLEVNFVDIGQGDGAFVVTPQDEILLIDAGQYDNMLRFLSWRYNLRRKSADPVNIKAAVISHSDQDHYLGFRELFASPQFVFETVYHNGLVERAGKHLLGPPVEANEQEYITDIIDDYPTLLQRLADETFVGSKQYPRMLKSAAENGRVGAIQALEAADAYLPGFGADKELAIEIRAPVRETVHGTAGLRSFDSDSKTKNGHSIVLRLVYHGVKILLGGDLNVPAERYLLGHYSGLDAKPADEDARAKIVARAREVFASDVAKSCHHGSADFTDLFLQAVNPIATVISSGDAEQHAHPRPDTLGAIGKHGRGERPLIFSTELSRSANETITNPSQMRKHLQDLHDDLQKATTNSEQEAIEREINRLIERSVAVYGMINLRTDGHKVLLAYKLEHPRDDGTEFDVHRLEPGEDGELKYVSYYL